jgi:hypothetical protein
MKPETVATYLDPKLAANSVMQPSDNKTYGVQDDAQTASYAATQASNTARSATATSPEAKAAQHTVAATMHKDAVDKHGAVLAQCAAKADGTSPTCQCAKYDQAFHQNMADFHTKQAAAAMTAKT